MVLSTVSASSLSPFRSSIYLIDIVDSFHRTILVEAFATTAAQLPLHLLEVS